MSPSTRQSASHCYHGSITKAGNSLARWLLTQAARQVANHPDPLGVFYRRIHKRKNFNVAVVATARKLVTIGYLMLKEMGIAELPERLQVVQIRTYQSRKTASVSKKNPS